MKPEQLTDLASALEALDLNERLKLLARTFPAGSIAFSSSLGLEDQAITHAISQTQVPVRIFTLDTGRLFEETQSLLAATRERLGVQVQVFVPDALLLQEFLTSQGPNSFYESVEGRLECCRIRKVEPLRRALQGAQVWITGLRREQSANRATLPIAEWDSEHKLVKVHPLIDWSEEQLRDYVATNNIPVNRLHAKGFPSIGCAPCTRAVKPGEDPRSGRWWWEIPNKKECGLHLHTGEKG